VGEKMKNKIILALTCLMSSIPVSLAGKETQLTSGERLTVSTSIYGNLVTWLETAVNAVHVYDLTARKELELDITEGTDSNIKVYENKIVWSEPGNDIFMYDISIGKETKIASEGNSPDIFGNYIVYISEQNNIYLYDLNTHNVTKIDSKAASFSSPSIYGKKVVWSQPNSDNASDVYIYDISTHQKSTITTTSNVGSNPDIHGNIVVWIGSSNGKDDVFMRDISKHKTTQVTTSGMASEPAIYDNWIVYTNSDSTGGSDIYLYEISTAKTRRITTSKSAFGPSIFGDKIIYADGRNDPEFGEVRDIYMYDLAAKS
jgi:beta propeller repeat protein